MTEVKKTAEEILLKHFNIAKEKYPDESWKKFDEVKIEREFVTNAMHEYSQQVNADLLEKLEEFIWAYDNSSPSKLILARNEAIAAIKRARGL